MKLKMIKVPYQLIINGEVDKSYSKAIREYFANHAKTYQEMVETGTFIIEDYSLCQINYKTLVDRFSVKLGCAAVKIHKFRINKEYISIYVDEYDFKAKQNYDINSIRFSLPVISEADKKIHTIHLVVDRATNYLTAPIEETPIKKPSTFDDFFSSFFNIPTKNKETKKEKKK